MASRRQLLARCLTDENSHICTFTAGVAHLRGDSGAGIVLERANRKHLVAVSSCGAKTVRAAQLMPGIHATVYPHFNWIRQLSGIVA